MLRPIFVKMFGTQELRDKILCQFSELSDLHNLIKEPFFVYAHFLPPHPPYVFGPNGEFRQPESLSPNDRIWGDRLSYIDQIQFVNKKIIETIDKILLESNTPPIIILQGDHGPSSLISVDGTFGRIKQSDEFIRERMSILNAYYLPDQNSKLIYDSITPVNSFRLILNAYFNENYELLDDKNYYSNYGLYNYTDVTEKLLLNTIKK